MGKRQKDILEQLSYMSPVVQCTLIVAALSILVLIMFYPATGTALTSFLITLSFVVNRFRGNRQLKSRDRSSSADQS